MISPRYSIVMNQGATFLLPISMLNDDETVFNLTGYTARGQIRRTYSSPTSLAAFTIIGTLDTNGTFTIKLTDTETSNLPPGTWRYDVEIVNASGVTRILEGRFKVLPEVTK